MSVQWSSEQYIKAFEDAALQQSFRFSDRAWALNREVRKWQATALCCSALAFISGWGACAWLR